MDLAHDRKASLPIDPDDIGVGANRKGAVIP